MARTEDLKRVAAKVAQKIRAVVVESTVPVVTGELRKSIHVAPHKSGFVVGTNKGYARAVHEGRPALTIRPKHKKTLFWRGAVHPVRRVFQPARRGKPFLRDGVDRVIGSAASRLSARNLGIENEVLEIIKRDLKILTR